MDIFVGMQNITLLVYIVLLAIEMFWLQHISFRYVESSSEIPHNLSNFSISQKVIQRGMTFLLLDFSSDPFLIPISHILIMTCVIGNSHAF